MDVGGGQDGLALWLRRRYVVASFAPAGYSVSGLIGIGHYLAPGAFEMPRWRQGHVVADILCGLVIFTVWAAQNMPRYPD